MAGDITCCIEYEYFAGHGKSIWACLATFHPRSNSQVFTSLGFRDHDGPAARGLPHDRSFRVVKQAMLSVVDDPAAIPEGSIRRSEAVALISKGESTYTDETEAWITKPGIRSPGWCTPDEWQASIAQGDGLDYNAVTQLLNLIASQRQRARVVFWFDR